MKGRNTIYLGDVQRVTLVTFVSMSGRLPPLIVPEPRRIRGCN